MALIILLARQDTVRTGRWQNMVDVPVVNIIALSENRTGPKPFFKPAASGRYLVPSHRTTGSCQFLNELTSYVPVSIIHDGPVDNGKADCCAVLEW